MVLHMMLCTVTITVCRDYNTYLWDSGMFTQVQDKSNHGKDFTLSQQIQSYEHDAGDNSYFLRGLRMEEEGCSYGVISLGKVSRRPPPLSPQLAVLLLSLHRVFDSGWVSEETPALLH